MENEPTLEIWDLQWSRCEMVSPKFSMEIARKLWKSQNKKFGDWFKNVDEEEGIKYLKVSDTWWHLQLNRKLVCEVRGRKDDNFILDHLFLKSLWYMRRRIRMYNSEGKLGLERKDMEVVGIKVETKVGDLLLQQLLRDIFFFLFSEEETEG